MQFSRIFQSSKPSKKMNCLSDILEVCFTKRLILVNDIRQGYMNEMDYLVY